MSGCCGVFPDYLQELHTVFFSLALTYPGDVSKLCKVEWQARTHLLQGSVVEYDIRRNTLVLRQLPPAVPQGLPKGDINVSGQGGAGLLPFCFCGGLVTAQLDLLFTSQQ